MKVLIKQAHILSLSSPLHGQIKDIFVTDGIITLIADIVNDKADETIQQPGLCVSIGWMDIFADFADPGYEFRETIETGVKAAASGGFTDVMLLPNTNPVTDNKPQVEYIIQKDKQTPVTIHPIGSVTKNAEGSLLSEMYDMQSYGAVAFSDGIHSIQSAGILLKALQYIKSFNGTIIQIPDDKSISPTGLMNEGVISTRLGLPGMFSIAEELMVLRDIELARYTDSRIHFTAVSSAKSLEHIKKAKKNRINVTCSVTPYHLYFCDEDLQDYDTNLKVNPPLRTAADVLALRKALIDGTIDCIASHHFPQSWDNKACEFEYARYGMIGLESLFGVIWSIVNTEWEIEKLVSLMTISPRKIFGLEIPQIAEGAKACLTLFNINEEYLFNDSMIKSASKNSPFINKFLKGRVIGIINKNQVYLNK